MPRDVGSETYGQLEGGASVWATRQGSPRRGGRNHPRYQKAARRPAMVRWGKSGPPAATRERNMQHVVREIEPWFSDRSTNLSSHIMYVYYENLEYPSTIAIPRKLLPMRKPRYDQISNQSTPSTVASVHTPYEPIACYSTLLLVHFRWIYSTERVDPFTMRRFPWTRSASL